MSTTKDIGKLYDWINLPHLLSTGDYGGLSCAFFNGDYRKTIDEAQKDKYNWILEGLNFKPNHRIIDIGCGLGGMLNEVRLHKGIGVGLTISKIQADYCQKKGIDGRLLDYKEADPKELGQFNGITSMGAFEHFCSPQEYKEGKQFKVYKQFFDFCSELLPKGGRLFLQTMIWGKEVPDPDKAFILDKNNESSLITYRFLKLFPHSWLPSNLQQIIDAASNHFEFISSNNGRLDYIETCTRWNREGNVNRLSFKNLPRNILHWVGLIPRYIMEPDFRVQIISLKQNDLKQVFVQKILDHERIFFEKK